jgi:hypothetical protein
LALTRVKNWSAGEVLVYSDLNNEFNNIINNATSLVSPWVGSLDLDGNTLILDGDADTSIDAATDDTIDISISGADDFRLTANTFTALSGSSISVVSGNITVDAGALTITDGQTTLADPGSHTNTVVTPLIVQSTTSGTPAAGIGTGILLKSESGDENPSNVAQISAYFGDVSAGSEDSIIQFQQRVAGAALTPTYAFAATGAFLGTFTHANAADRVYTLPDYTATLATVGGAETLVNKTINAVSNTITNINTTALKTATGSASGNLSSAVQVAMNDYAFFPNCQLTNVSTGPGVFHLYQEADTSTTVGRFRLATTGDASDSYVIRWRYVTASDKPEFWAVYNPGTGLIEHVWVSDDPLPDGSAPLTVAGLTSKRFTAQALEQLTALSGKADEAARLILDKGLSMANQAYRALQLLANDEAPALWLLNNCVINTTTGRLQAKA